MAAPVILPGCSAAPSQNVLGSYFPSWMICAAAGLLLSAVAHRLFALVGIDKEIPIPVVTFLAIAVLASFLVWLTWLG